MAVTCTALAKKTPCRKLIEHAAERLYPKHYPPTEILNSTKQGKLQAIDCRMLWILPYIVSAALARETSSTVQKLGIVIVL